LSSWLIICKMASYSLADILCLTHINNLKLGKDAVIAVGGLSLSRGLTIEGLTVSYMYRNTKMYDTLMQMGRWFGFRSGYEELTRIYTTN
jgi:hypothetical protein